MAFEQRDNSGSLFKNDKKQAGDNKPHMTGKAMIDGKMYFFDAWTKEGTKGRWQSVSFTLMDNQPESAAPAPAARQAPAREAINNALANARKAAEDNDIPF